MSINSSGKKLEGFFTGKGFYIVLFLCAAVIGLSAWMMAAGNEAMDDLTELNNGISFDASKVETIIIPPQSSAEEYLCVFPSIFIKLGRKFSFINRVFSYLAAPL